MRCRNCGWQNPNGVSTCERCGSKLEGEEYSAETLVGQNSEKPSVASQSLLRSTVREVAAFCSQDDASSCRSSTSQLLSNDSEPSGCPNCGYSISPEMNACPQCGTSMRQRKETNFVSEESCKNLNARSRQCPKCGAQVSPGAKYCHSCGQQLRMTGTVNSWDNPQGSEFCSLRPIPWSRENVNYPAISFSGEQIILNRANTDPNNQSITSREQAVLTYEGGDWYIEDKSDQNSTMIRVTRKTKLQSGDIIAMGNRLFEFRD